MRKKKYNINIYVVVFTVDFANGSIYYVADKNGNIPSSFVYAGENYGGKAEKVFLEYVNCSSVWANLKMVSIDEDRDSLNIYYTATVPLDFELVMGEFKKLEKTSPAILRELVHMI